MLSLEVEFLNGVSYASTGPWSSAPDWPPQPDRVFSALVAAWASRGGNSLEREALEWLERLPPAWLEASPSSKRSVGIAYVPPNDSDGKVEVLPERRRRQGRFFPAAVPVQSTIRYFWEAEPELQTLAALDNLARDVAYVGHSASLVRCRFSLAQSNEAQGTRAKKTVYPGRLAELERNFQAGQRPAPGLSVRERITSPPKPIRASVFSPNWVVLDDDGGACPDIRATTVVSRLLRKALMSRYGTNGTQPPLFLSGHEPDGAPCRDPHLAIIPLADVGYQYSQGLLKGMGLVIPRTLEEQWKTAERSWLEGLDAPALDDWRKFDTAIGDALELNLPRTGSASSGAALWRLRRIASPTIRALDAREYCGPSERWSTVTPIVLDRFPKAKTADGWHQEVSQIIASACVNIDLPEPKHVRPAKHALHTGVVSSAPSGNAPAWTGWTLAGPFARKFVIHAVIQFPEPVLGPIILGAGRYSGMGLCRPVAGKGDAA